MKILFCIGSLRFSGAERVLLFIANSLNEKGFEVKIIVMQDSSNILYDNPLNKGIKVTNIKNEGNIFKKNVRRIISIRKALIEYKPDIAISFGYILNPLLLISKLGIKTPVMISERNDPVLEPNNTFYRIIRKITYPIADTLIVQTSEIANYFEKIVKKTNIQIIPNPITKNSPKKSYDKFNYSLVSVGRLDQHQKNQLMMINAFSRINNLFPDSKLTIYGEGGDRKKYEEKIESLGLNEKIFLPGEVMNVQTKTIENDLFLLTSNFEGMPNALIEAMSSGMACISTDCGGGGARFLMKSDNKGILIKKDDEDGLVSSVIDLFENKHKMIELGERAITVNDELNKEKIVQMWIDQIKKTIKGRTK